jgi:tetratricopeptide (TPR) repeat protein
MRLGALIIGVLAFLLYSNSLKNGFVLDDSLVILKNSFTNQGLKGLSGIFTHDTFQGYYGESSSEIKIIGGRYRPLSLAFFAFIYQLFGPDPLAFHFWNVLLYAVCCAFLFRVIWEVFAPRLGTEKVAVFSGLAALLFTVHPVHTEVVNNIKSNDEILCLLLSLASLFLAIRYWDTRKNILAWMSGIALFLACLAKENAVVFLAIIPLSIYFRQLTNKKSSPAAMPLLFSLGIAFVLYFIIRYSILGWSLGEAHLDLINNPFIKLEGGTWVHCSMGEKLAMIFWSLGKYLLLLVFPLTLSTDYYPRYVDVITFSNPAAAISLLIYLGLGLLVAYKLWKGDKKLYVYGIAFFLVALSIVSNLVFPIGTNLAERFIFTPSAGFAMAVSALALPLFSDQRKWISQSSLVCTAIVILLFIVRTYDRNFDFISNKVLFEKDVQVSTNSAKIQNGLGALLAEEALNMPDPARKRELAQQAMDRLNKAIEIHPTYLEAFYMRGNVYFMFGQYENAIQDYRRCLSLNANFKDAYGNYALSLREGAREILSSNGDIQKAIAYLEESLKLFPDEKETADLLAKAKQVLPAGK